VGACTLPCPLWCLCLYSRRRRPRSL